MSDIEILILIGFSLGAGIVMLGSHFYLRFFFELHFVTSYVYGSLVNIGTLLLALLLIPQITIIKIVFCIIGIWGFTGLVVLWAYRMDFWGNELRRKKTLKQQMNKGNGKRTG
jgi:hypothetical protein